MPPLPGFSDNAFETHSDSKAACIALLRALKRYQSPGGARIRLPLATGTHFDDIAAQLEGFARPLWAVGALLHGGCLTEEEFTELAQPYVQGLANGTDPRHPEYWGPVVVRDQRMVEMEIISFALLAAPDALFHRQSTKAQHSIREWLKTLNEKDFPITNWLWFRVMTNLALVQVCGVPYEEVKNFMNEDLDQMEQFYLDEGWAADGIWSENGRQADHYSGSFAIQFSQLLYSKMAENLDPMRCAKFRDRAIAFSSSFWRYFDENGAAIPFGRSLTYRFAFAGFWAAAAFAGVNLPAPLNDPGVVKGLLLRHFRWWSDKHDMFNVDGTLTIGFAYPNMYMSEDYNSPQSPYWAMKSFVSLGLPPTHAFWTAEEKPLENLGSTLAATVKPPMQIVCNTGHHHFLLSSGQFCPWPLKATEAKYGKFAYSSHFGFSVPTGPLPAQMAADSTLALSRDGGDIWRVPWKLSSFSFNTAELTKNGQIIEEIPALRSTWRPWRDVDVDVETVLVAPCSRWPDWYIRSHRIINNGDHEVKLSALQGGFAIQGRGSRRGEVLPSFNNSADVFASHREPFHEGTLQTSDGALVCSNVGASGIRQLQPPKAFDTDVHPDILKPDANTNLMWQRTLIPTIALDMDPLLSGGEVQFVSGVFAMARRKDLERAYDSVNIGAKWNDPPVISNGKDQPLTAEYIVVG